MRDSFANRVREAAKDFRAKGKTFTPADLVEAIGVRTFRERKLVYNGLYDLVRSGEIQRVDRHIYGYVSRPNAPLPKQKIMWNYFRMRMKCGAPVTVEELQAAANASAKYTKEWLAFLVKGGIAKKLGNGRFQLLKDPVEMPVDERKAKRAKDLRKRKEQEVMEILEEIRKMALRAEEIMRDASQ